MNDRTDLITLGARIREIRISKGLSLSELAHLCEFEKASLSRIELGKTNTTILTLTRICNALECRLADLFIS